MRPDNAQLLISPLAAYTLLSGLSMVPELTRGSLAARGPSEVGMLVLWLAAAAYPQNSSLAILAFGTRIVWWLSDLPFTWDSELMVALTDLAVVLHMIADGNKAADGVPLGQSMRRMMGWFYWFAGFWKINSSFLDSRYSCASLYFASLLDAYVPAHMLTPGLTNAAIAAAPALTIIVECGVGVLFLARAYSSRAPRCGTAGVLLATALHVGIDLTPPPNNIAAFSHKAALRYVWFAPRGSAAAIYEVRAHPLVGSVYVAVGAAVLALTIAAQQPASWAQWTAAPLDALRSTDVCAVDWHIVAHCALSALLVRALWLGEGRTPRADVPAEPAPTPLVHVLTLLCLLWCCAAVVLGTLEINTPNMFSNLRMQGGTNHLLRVPTSLLHTWRYSGWAVGDDPFSGGVVRIEHSTSSHINELYPSEFTAILTPGTVRLLAAANHSGRHFNSAVSRIVGPFAVPPRAADAPFVRFTLPAFEVRRLLRDARAHGDPFELTYTSLPNATGDERWRTSAKGRTIRLVEGGAGGAGSCTVVAAGDGGADACQPSDLALAPFPTRDFVARPLEAALGFLQTWNALPILRDGDDELHCYGS